MKINGHDLHYVDEGTGEPIVMVHGNPTWSFYYRDLIRSLSPRYRTIAVDHIGCGLSEKPSLKSYDYRFKSRVEDFSAFVGHLNLEDKMTLVVHDWGGAIGMAYAVAHPDAIGRIVILNTAAFFPPNNKTLPKRLKIIRNILPFAIPAVLGFNVFARGAVFMAAKKGLAPDVRKGFLAPYNSWKNRVATLKFVQDIPLGAEDPGYSLIQKIQDNLYRLSDIPMLILWGQKDFVFDAEYLGEWRRRFPEAEVHSFPDAGHYILEDAKAETVFHIQRFLKEHPL